MKDKVVGLQCTRRSGRPHAGPDRYHLLHTLFESPLAPHLDHVAPQLASIDPDSGYLDLWAEHLGRSAGILLITSEPPGALRSHLREIFLASDEEDFQYSFRYYDPRVLRVYLPTCTGEEVQEFFGPIRRILVEAETPGVVLVCEPTRVGANIEERPIQQAQRRTPSEEDSP